MILKYHYQIYRYNIFDIWLRIVFYVDVFLFRVRGEFLRPLFRLFKPSSAKLLRCLCICL